MTVYIKNKNIELKYSFRSLMIYEKIVGSSFTSNGITEIIVFFYSTILASDKDIDLTFDEFIDYIDSNLDIFTEFSSWLTSIFTKNSVINDKENTADENTTDNLKKN